MQRSECAILPVYIYNARECTISLLEKFSVNERYNPDAIF